MSLARSALVLALLSAPVVPAFAATTWHVSASAACPGLGTVAAPFCTIQAALDAAVSGDEILVAPGLYTETLDFLGKDVALSSTAGPATTIVDGGHTGSIVTFDDGEGRGALISGFTLHNGGNGIGSAVGGGVRCVDSSPTITNCVIESCFGETGGGMALLGGSPLVVGNLVRDNGADFGAGIACDEGTTAQILDNEIVSNGFFGTGGGGINVSDSAVLIEGNLIEGNNAAGGGGLYIESNVQAIVRGNVIRENVANEGDAGGIFTAPNALVESNVIADNFAYNDASGVYAWGGTYRNNRITGNQSDASSWAVVATNGATFDGDVIANNPGFGPVVNANVSVSSAPIRLTRVTIAGHTGQIALTSFVGPVILEDCLIAGNGEGLYSFGPGHITARRCTLTGQTVVAASTVSGHIALESCIVWDNSPSGDELAPGLGTIDATWSIVQGGWPGTGNLDADPLFVDAPGGNFSLSPGSPAIDSGNPADGICAFDIAGTPRRLDGHLDVGSEIDRGAFEFGNGHLETSVPIPTELKIDLSGTPGLQAWLFAGLTPGQLCVEKWGRFGLNLSGPYIVVPWFSAPSSIDVTIAPAFSGLPIVLQALVGNAGQFGVTGNLTNAVAVELP